MQLVIIGFYYFMMSLKKCYVDGIEKRDLISNIKNLVNLIDDYYKQFLTDGINGAITDKRDSTFMIPSHLIIRI